MFCRIKATSPIPPLLVVRSPKLPKGIFAERNKHTHLGVFLH